MIRTSGHYSDGIMKSEFFLYSKSGWTGGDRPIKLTSVNTGTSRHSVPANLLTHQNFGQNNGEILSSYAMWYNGESSEN